jgi:phosphonoacetate hydrolase
MREQRTIIAMMDGFGMGYYESAPLPTIKKMAADGFFKTVSGVFPSVTNVNNVSIACGAWPEDHGIVANSYFDSETGSAQYMNAAELIDVPTVFERARKQGVGTALLTSKRKTLELFHKHLDFGVAAEAAPPELVAKYGEPAGIYSREINYWLWSVAVDLLKTRPELGLVYVHITDYPMHAWDEKAPESIEHLTTLDSLIGDAIEAAPDAAVYLTADHGMNAKKSCWDLDKVCSARGVPVRFVLSPERDYYIKHHRNFTGCSWIWLHDPADADKVTSIVKELNGVEDILPRDEAAKRFHLRADRIGDLTVLGDKDTMFGEMDNEYEDLAADYRAHGSLYEMHLPFIIYNEKGQLPNAEAITANKDLTRWLYR